MLARRLVAGFLVMLGVAIAVTCVSGAGAIAPRGTPEVMVQAWCYGIALLQLVPIVGVEHFALRKSRLGSWLLWFVPSIVIVLIGSMTVLSF